MTPLSWTECLTIWQKLFPWPLELLFYFCFEIFEFIFEILENSSLQYLAKLPMTLELWTSERFVCARYAETTTETSNVRVFYFRRRIHRKETWEECSPRREEQDDWRKKIWKRAKERRFVRFFVARFPIFFVLVFFFLNSQAHGDIERVEKKIISSIPSV